MSRLIEFTIDSDSPDETILMEVSDFNIPAGEQMVSRGGAVVERAQQTFDEALERVRPAVVALGRKLQSGDHAPDAITVSFGIKMTAQAGAVIASADAEASFTVTVNWSRTEATPV